MEWINISVTLESIELQKNTFFKLSFRVIENVWAFFPLHPTYIQLDSYQGFVEVMARYSLKIFPFKGQFKKQYQKWRLSADYYI